MYQLHNTVLGDFCQNRGIARSISVAESFDSYCCVSVCLSALFFSLLKCVTDARIHLHV